MRRRWRWPARLAVGAVVVVVTVAAGVGVAVVLVGRFTLPDLLTPTPASPPSPSCLVTTPSGRLRLDPAQAENVATIAAVGKRMGLEDHAVTVALVASLQESKLRNLPSGDLDSVGLFQQRPSQGWGAPVELIDPVYAASAFYRALVRVPGWAAMPVGDAAQQVQHSAAPDAYGPWEGQGRILAEAFTGEVGAALACRFAAPASPSPSPTLPAPLEDAVTAELGSPAFGAAVPDARGWTVASWLVGHAYEYGISSVTFKGQQWTPSSGAWSPRPPGPVTDEVVLTRL